MRIDANALTHNLMSAADVRAAARAATRGQRQNATPPPSAQPAPPSLANAAPAAAGERPLRPSSNAHGPANAQPPIALSPNESEQAGAASAANLESDLIAPVGRNDQPRPDRVQALLNAWGQTDSHFDLNDDGTVDGFDLAHLLARMSGASGDSSHDVTTSQPNPPGADLSETAVEAGILAPAQSEDAASAALIDLPTSTPSAPSDPKLQGLLAKWGSDDAAFDLNDDGIVNGFDLALRLGEATGPVTPTVDEPTAALASAVPATAAPAALVGEPPATQNPSLDELVIGSAAAAIKTTDALAQSDESAPPLNLATLAERMLARLAPDQRDDEPRMQRVNSRAARGGSETAARRERLDVAPQPDVALTNNDEALRTLRAALDRLQLAGDERQRALQSLLGAARDDTKINSIG